MMMIREKKKERSEVEMHSMGWFQSKGKRVLSQVIFWRLHQV